jgi:ribosomal protein RSM22 (predicted rRNA methylase)
MQLPEALRTAIEQQVTGVAGGELARASAELTDRYRALAGDGARADARHIETPAHRLAYVVVRAPATYAAVRAVLDDVASRLPKGSVRSVLDVGAGPGVAAWAAVEAFPEVERITLVERDAELDGLGRRLAASAPHPALASARWLVADADRGPALEPHDLVVASYVVGEFGEKAIHRITGKFWEAAAAALVVVEPGTPAGFATVLAVRSELIGIGAGIVAPCPHDGACPMGEGDWCHFAARVERTALHRRLKGGDLGHEDEKYSYVAASRLGGERAEARIVRRPRLREKHVELELCAREGLARRVVTKKDRAAYRRARKSGWGDAWEEPATLEEGEES